MNAAKIKRVFGVAITLFVLCAVSCNFEPYQGNARIGIDLGDIGRSEETVGGSRAVDLPPGMQASDIVSVTISISGPDLSKQSTTYSLPPRYLYIFVPPGKERTVGVQLNIDPDHESAVLAFGGETTISLKPGQFQWVQIWMAPVETKLVIPDLLRSRLVQVDDITGTAWIEKGANDGISNPTDIDFDSLGRIFMAYDGAGLFVIDNLTDMNTSVFGVGRNNYTVAIDNVNNYAYYMPQGGPLSKTNIDNQQDHTDFDIAAELQVNLQCYGIAVDDQGFVYILNSAADSIYKYNPDPTIPAQDRLLAQYNNLLLARDVMVKDGYVYVATVAPSIVRFTTDLASPQTLGTAATVVNDTTPGHFFGPSRFIGISRNSFRLIDEGSLTYPVGIDLDRVVVFNSINGWNGWQARQGTEMTGGSEFDFFLNR